MSSRTIHISFVVHKGFLETQSVLLVCSILSVYGDEVQIYAGVPEHLGGIENGISEKYKSILIELGVIFFNIKNPIGEDYPIGNKLDCFVKTEDGIKIFLDTDTILLNRFDLSIFTEQCLAAKPADRKTYKWSSEDWNYAYERYCGKRPEIPKMYSTSFYELMYPYYNAGVIFVSGIKNFKSEWQNLASQIDLDNRLSNKRPWLDQLTLPLVIRKNNYKTINLSEKFNYPAHLKSLEEEKEIPFLVHYHKPNIISRDRFLVRQIKKLKRQFPILEHVFSESTEHWKELNKITKADTSNKVLSTQNVVITGLPRSGTSFLCSLLSKYADSLVLNEPKEVFKPINRQPIPYGLACYYSEIRKEVLLNKPLQNKHRQGELISDTVETDYRESYLKSGLQENYHLYTKNTLAYLFAIERIKQSMPNSIIIALFRDPVDTIASWINSFDHLKMSKPLELNTVRLQRRWFSKKDNITLKEINECQDDMVRRAIFWNFMATKLIKNAHQVRLINYDDLVTNTNNTLMKLRMETKQKTINLSFKPSEIRSKRSLLSEQEIQLIENITFNVYKKLLSLV